MWWIVSDLNLVSKKSKIPSPTLQTAFLIATASYSVGTGGSAVQHETYNEIYIEQFISSIKTQTG
jgi:hypothetical protein